MHHAAPILVRLLPVSYLHSGASPVAQKAFVSPSTSSRIDARSLSVPSWHKPSSTTATTIGFDELTFSAAVKHRRTIYNLINKSPITDDRIQEIVTQTIKDSPSSFNSQSTRLVVLTKEKHEQFWDIVIETLKAQVPEAQWENTGQRLTGFRNAYGTVLFYEDPEPVKKLQTAFAQYAAMFPNWSDHASAMHQYVLWTALEAEGLGANLQHYNPLPDQRASEVYGVPSEWSLKAQLVFGTPGDVSTSNEHLPKEQQPLDKRIFFHGF